MVSKDVNRNGIADDPWYELRGSADDETPNRVVYGYEVTYTSAPMQDIPWTDNKGGSGKVERNKYHAQKSIIPCGCHLKLPIRAAFYLRTPYYEIGRASCRERV